MHLLVNRAKTHSGVAHSTLMPRGGPSILPGQHKALFNIGEQSFFKQAVKRDHMGKAFVVPFLIYLLGTNAAARFEGTSYALAYGLVVSLVIAFLIYSYADWRPALTPFSAKDVPSAKQSGLIKRGATGVVVGVIGIVLWVALCELRIEEQLFHYLPKWLQPAARVGFNPFEEFEASGAFVIGSFIAVRLLGLAVVVPLMEELFWRGFLLRWFIDSEWQRVPIGAYSFSSSALVTLLFTLAHPELIAAAVYCVLLNALLYRTRDLLQCIVAHAASNLSLGIYVLLSGAWDLW